jgi:hypothetical protein
MLLACVAMHAGSGIRIARPTQVAGQALGALGALLLAVFAFLPGEGAATPYAVERLLALSSFPEGALPLLPFLLAASATTLALFNLLRSRAEVPLAKLTRLLLVGALFAVLALPLLGADRAHHHAAAWGGLRLLAPIFLALDGAVAYLAATITRGDE